MTKVKEKKVESEDKSDLTYQPKLNILLNSGDMVVDSDFNHIYYKIKYDAWTNVLQEEIKDLIGRVINKHEGYRRSIVARLKFGLNDWLTYQGNEGNLTEPTKRVLHKGNYILVKKSLYQKAKGAESIYNWLMNDMRDVEGAAPSINIDKTDEVNLNLKLSDVIFTIPIYNHLMNLFVEKQWCEAGTFKWIDTKNGYKTLIASLLKHLHAKGYYVLELSANQIILIGKNTFGITISAATVNHAKSKNYQFKIIPVATTIKL